MAYARMRVICKDALICDFAQYYHIYDIYGLDLQTAAILACGLPQESRTIRQLAGQKYTLETILYMGILDCLRSIEHAYMSVHSKKGKKLPKPKSIFELLNDKKEENDIKAFRTAEDFEAERERILKEINDG